MTVNILGLTFMRTSSYEALVDKVDTMAIDLADAQMAMQSASNEYKLVRDERKNLYDQKLRLEAENSLLRADATTRDKGIATLKAEKEDLSTDNKNLKEKNKELKAQIDDMQRDAGSNLSAYTEAVLECAKNYDEFLNVVTTRLDPSYGLKKASFKEEVRQNLMHTQNKVSESMKTLKYLINKK